MKTKSIPFRFFPVLLAVGLSCLAAPDRALGTNYIFTGAAGNSWYNVTNWFPEGIPGSVDTIGIGSGSVNIPNAAFFDLHLSGGTINGSFTVAGTLEWSGGTINGELTVASNGVINMSGDSGWPWSGVMINYGHINLKAGSYNYWLFNNARLENQPGGLIDLQVDGNFYANSGSPVFNNAGTLRKSAGTLSGSMGIPFNNTGLVDIQKGNMQITANYSLAGGWINCGLRSSTDYSSIALPGSAALAGTLSVSLTGGYSPAFGDSFDVVTYPSFSATFDNLSLPVLPGTGLWNYNFGTTKVTLSVGSGQPLVTSTPSGGNLLLGWSAYSFPGYHLFYTTNLAPPVSWQNVTNPVQVINNQNVVSVPKTGDARFFQLIK